MIREMKFVYVIGSRHGPRKIGASRNPALRCGKLATGHAAPLSVQYSAQVPAEEAADVEALAHLALVDRRQHGEWFRVSLDEARHAIANAIDAVKRGERAGKKSVGRIRRWAEDMQARFAEGTFARIAAVLKDGEDRTDFIREAVEAELKRRESK